MTAIAYALDDDPSLQTCPAEALDFVKYKLAKQFELKLTVFTRDDFTCQQCGRIFVAPKDFDGSQIIKDLTLGHIVPKSKGGKRKPNNLKAQCRKCNSRLGDKTWTEFIDKHPLIMLYLI